MANYLIYQAYGSPDILNEALLSILSYLRQPADATVLVYTDQPAHFQAVLGAAPSTAYVFIEPAQWRAWRGEIDFVHRVKIKVLQHAAAHYAGQLLYVDTDTIFMQPVAPIFAALARGERFMHVGEGRLGDGNPLNRKINRALRAGGVALAGGPIGPETRMYNAGALGLHSPTDAPLLAEVLALTEQLYRLYPKHVMEQLAFSAVLSAAGPVREAAPGIFHYWNLKEARPLLAAFFTRYAGRPLPELLPHLGEVPIQALSAEKAHFESRPGWQRALLRWLGREWRVPA